SHGATTVATTNIDELVARASPAVAHVLVPPTHHATVARELLERGVGVLIEKPMTVAAGEALALVELARTKGLPLAVNHNQTFHPGFVRMKQLISKGAVGRVDHVFGCLS